MTDHMRMADTLRGIRSVIARDWLKDRGGIAPEEAAAFDAASALLEREALVAKLVEAAFDMADRCTVGNFDRRQNVLRACAKRVVEFGK